MFNRMCLAALLLWPAAPPADAQQGGDLQARILYAYYSEDLNQLADLTQSLGEQVKSAPTTALRYHLAHADYRFAELARERLGARAEAALKDCVAQLRAILEQDAESVEALALDSACREELAAHAPLQAVMLRARAASRLQEAYRLAPSNPRVNLLMAQAGLARGKPDSPERRRALAQLQSAAQLFDESSATSADTPGWGHAQAYLALGHEMRLRGDVLEARNWVEKALIAAPDFKAAQRELKAILGR
jgi:hypothetical protein